MSSNDREISVDLKQLQTAVDDMNSSRKNMYDAIVDLNNVRKKLASQDIWQGDGATAVLEAYNRNLNSILIEEKRLEALSSQLTAYIEELKENERITALSAQNMSGNPSGEY